MLPFPRLKENSLQENSEDSLQENPEDSLEVISLEGFGQFAINGSDTSPERAAWVMHFGSRMNGNCWVCCRPIDPEFFATITDRLAQDPGEEGPARGRVQARVQGRAQSRLASSAAILRPVCHKCDTVWKQGAQMQMSLQDFKNSISIELDFNAIGIREGCEYLSIRETMELLTRDFDIDFTDSFDSGTGVSRVNRDCFYESLAHSMPHPRQFWYKCQCSTIEISINYQIHAKLVKEFYQCNTSYLRDAHRFILNRKRILYTPY